MRYLCLVLPAFFALLPPASFGETVFPYIAYSGADDVYVRSGPGSSYYPTSKLGLGEPVEIYIHEPGGWCAIRPIEGSFSWVAERQLEVGEDGLARVIGDRVPAWVGSEFSDIRTESRVGLDRDEVVQVLGGREFQGESGPSRWYKIAPPSGEFRWVYSGDLVQNDPRVRNEPRDPPPEVPMGQPNRQTLPGPRSPSESPKPLAPDTAAIPSDVEATPVAPSANPTTLAANPAATAVDPEATVVDPAATVVDPGATPVDPGATVVDPTAPLADRAALPADQAGKGAASEQFRRELEDLDMELSTMLAEELTVWSFDGLIARSQNLLGSAETALERGRVRLVINRIQRSREIKQRSDKLDQVQLAALAHKGRSAIPGRYRDLRETRAAEQGRFDGTGRLMRIAPANSGGPRYALVDIDGTERCYVSPAPGVNLSYYEGRQIGVNGILDYLSDRRAQHVTVKHVALLERTRLR